MRKSVCIIFGQGCARTRFAAALFFEYFTRNGWKVVDSVGEANIVLISTCAFEEFNEEMSIKLLSIVNNRKGNDTQLIAFGCLPGIAKDRLEKYDAVALPPRDYDRLDELIGASIKLDQIENPHLIHDYIIKSSMRLGWVEKLLTKSPIYWKFRDRIIPRFLIGKGPQPLAAAYDNVFDIRIGTGCMSECSFCAIRFAVGTIKSRPLDKILAEFRTGLAEKHTVFRLIADDVGGYGQDIDTSFVELLRNLFSQEQDFTLVFDDFSPRWLIKYFPELLDLFVANVERIGYVGFPIQSGSDRILRLMKREYNAKDVRDCLIALKQAIPGLKFTTHVIIGFPGETEADFGETIEFIRTVRPAHVIAYKYSKRPGTDAAQLPGEVSTKTRNRRAHHFRRLFRPICFLH
jgi:tRNA A37 methylthiotransferase MiaB